MRILIAGGGGFVGRHIVERFGDRHDFINLSLSTALEGAVNNIRVDLTRPLDFLKLDKPVDLIINCVECHPVSFAGDAEMKKAYLLIVRHLLEYAKNNHSPKFMHFSVNNIGTVENDYQQAKFVAEGIVEHSGLTHLIFKPSIIFGDKSPLDRLIEAVMSRGVLPRFWDKRVKISPVHISDVLENVGHALENDGCWNNTYSLCGPEYMGFEEILLRHAPMKPRFFKAPAFAQRAVLNKTFQDAPPRHLKLLLDWIGSDNLCAKAPLLRPQVFY
ncbi:MAG: NAD-dependent epimerase/dehydratase family protein [Campylobacterales bacterium]